MSNLTQRILFAAVGIPVVLYVVLAKPIAFFALAVMLAGLTVTEYYGLAKVKGYSPQVVTGVIFSMLVTASFGKFRLQALLSKFGISILSPQYEVLGIIIMIMSIVILIGEQFRNLPNPIVQTAVTMFGAIYIGVGLGSLFGIYEYFTIKNVGLEHIDFFPAGLFIAVFLVSIWIGDSAAYFAGRSIGKHKVSERISPGKTWEGSIACFIFTIGTWIAALSIFYALSVLPLHHAIAIGAIIGVIGQFGDFGKSLLKRDAGVKDSSNLLPGHGGVLDRLDSIIFASPAVLIYLWIAQV